MKRYDISLLPKNFFMGGSFYKKKGRGVAGKGGRSVGRAGGGRGGRGGGEIKKK